MLDLNKEYGNLLTEEQRKTIENLIKKLDAESKKMPYNNLYELLGIGLDDQQQQALNTAFDNVRSNLESIADYYSKAADAAVNAAETHVSAAQKVLDAEIEARSNGYANNVEMAQKNLEVQRKNREKALKEQQKAQRAQLVMDTATQTSSLITASANIWKSFSALGPLGVAGAIAAIATMWASFAAAKVKAVQVATQSDTEEYGEGTVELLQGGSHASGHDIDLGTKSDGTRRRAEGGEFFAVINKRNSKRFRDVIPDVINSFNDGTFADRYQRANETMAGYALGMIGGGTTDIRGLESDVAAIRKQGETTRETEGGATIIKYKNLTRKIQN